MNVSGISNNSNLYNQNSIFNSQSSNLGEGTSDQIARAAAVAEQGFQQSLQAKAITNAYAAGKEVR